MKQLLTYMVAALTAWLSVACVPDKMEYHDNTHLDVSVVDRVELWPNQKIVLADGHAQLDLYPRLFTKDNLQIPDSRVNEEWLEYVPVTPGIQMTGRYFYTSDASLIGKEIKVKLSIKGTSLESDTVSFTVADPQASAYASDIRIPVVFHIIQTKEDVELYGGEYKQERVQMQLNRLNNMLNASVSNNPVGVNSHIRLEMAASDPNGNQMPEPGINRLTVDKLSFKPDGSDVDSFLVSKSNLIWPEDHYLNIWLISDRSNSVTDFANSVTAKCAPVYVLPGSESLPAGIQWQNYEGQSLKPHEAGIIYKLQKLDDTERTFYVSDNIKSPGYNDLGYYFGQYLGLLPTCNYKSIDTATTDYCDDTMDYAPSENGNKGWYKTFDGCYFRAENLMDDPTGVHCSVSRDQAIRMRWVLNHCPGRFAWKSAASTHNTYSKKGL